MFYISVSDLLRVMAPSSWLDVGSSSSAGSEGFVVPYFLDVSLYPFLGPYAFVLSTLEPLVT